MKPTGTAFFFLLGILPLPARTQEPQPRPSSPRARRILSKAVRRTSGLEGYAFTGEISFPGNKDGGQAGGALPPFFIGGARPVGKEIDGLARAEGLVTFTMDGTSKGALRGGFILYEEGEGGWKLRLGTGPTGAPLWWLPDPTRLLEEILASKAKVELVRNDTLDQRPMRVLQVKLEKEAARDFFLSRLLPDPTKAPARRGNRMVFIMGGPRGNRVPKDLGYEILLWVDPGTSLVHKIHVKATASPQGLLPGGVVRIQVKGGKPIPQTQGKKKGKSRVDLEIRFRDLGKASPHGLPRSVLKRLGLSPLPPSKKKGQKV